MRRALIMMALGVMLAGCGGGGVRERVFPPTVSVQELALQSNGDWALKLRLQNFSNVSMRVDAVDAQLRVAGQDAGPISLQPGVSVPPESAEVVAFTLAPGATAAAEVTQAIAAGRGVRYAVQGTIRSSEPRSRRDDFTFESQLSVVPGLPGVLR